MSDEMIAYGGTLLAVGMLAFGLFVAPRIIAWYLGKTILPEAQKALHGYQKWATPPADEPDVSATQLRTWDHPTEGSQVELSHLEARKR